MWNGWSAVVVSALSNGPHAYRLRIQAKDGNDFIVLAKDGEVRLRTGQARLYSPVFTMAVYIPYEGAMVHG